MAVHSYEDLRHHLGHEAEIVGYGDYDNPANVAIECLTCMEVLLDFDDPGPDPRSDPNWRHLPEDVKDEVMREWVARHGQG